MQNQGADTFLDSVKNATPIINFHYNYQTSSENQPINEFITDSINEMARNAIISKKVDRAIDVYSTRK